MIAALSLAGLALGLTASPHCVLMCSAPCAAFTSGSRRSGVGFHAGRLLGYALAGGVAAGSMAALARLGAAAPALRPVWMLVQLAVFALGTWWLVTGRQPRLQGSTGAVPLRFFPRVRQPVRASLAGLAWALLPCAALQGALLLAALAGTIAGGMAVMALFALGSMPALLVAPWVWARWQAWQQHRGRGAPDPARVGAVGLRLAGGGLVLMSGWALTQGLWLRVAAWCAG